MKNFRESPKKQLPARLKRVDRTGQPNRKRTLTELQRYTVLGRAAARVREEARCRQCKWLRPLDTFQESGYRTSQTRWNAIAEMIEPMLARMDFATLTLGWLDQESGHFRFNRQRGLSEDTTLKEWTVSRSLKALEAAKYVRRKFLRSYHNGLGWITRVAIIIRPRFFIHLGLEQELARVREKKKAQRKRDKECPAFKLMTPQQKKAAYKEAETMRSLARLNASTKGLCSSGHFPSAPDPLEPPGSFRKS